MRIARKPMLRRDGAGTTSANAAPEISADGFPFLGRTIRVTGSGLIPMQSYALLFDFIGFPTIPALDLGTFGAPAGTMLYNLGGIAVSSVADANGEARVGVSVGASTSQIGTDLHAQLLQIDFALPEPIKVVVSRGLTVSPDAF
jgi:hypothetical protein